MYIQLNFLCSFIVFEVYQYLKYIYCNNVMITQLFYNEIKVYIIFLFFAN